VWILRRIPQIADHVDIVALVGKFALKACAAVGRIMPIVEGTIALT
jgi:hypothetical protein